MMKISIWGYGKYGRRMFESLTRFCSDEYEVVRVYDVKYAEPHDDVVEVPQVKLSDERELDYCRCVAGYHPCGEESGNDEYLHYNLLRCGKTLVLLFLYLDEIIEKPDEAEENA